MSDGELDTNQENMQDFENSSFEPTLVYGEENDKSECEEAGDKGQNDDEISEEDQDNRDEDNQEENMEDTKEQDSHGSEQEDVQKKIIKACKAVMENSLSIRGASTYYNVPYSSLHDRLKSGSIAKSTGRPKYLTEDEEGILVSYSIFRAVRGCPLSKKEFLNAIQSSLNKIGRKTKFKDNHPSIKWFDRFKKRHKLSLRKSEDLDGGRTRVLFEYFS